MALHSAPIVGGLHLAQTLSSRPDATGCLQVIVSADLLPSETEGRKNRRSADRIVNFVSPNRTCVSNRNFLWLNSKLVTSLAGDDLGGSVLGS